MEKRRSTSNLFPHSTGRISWSGSKETTIGLKNIVVVLQVACVLYITWSSFAPLSWGEHGGSVDGNYHITKRKTVMALSW